MNFRVDSSWQEIIDLSLGDLDKEYLEFLKIDNSFFPNRENFLNAFKTLSLKNTKYILFGQDPYPREESATGYAFIDGKVKSIFSSTGLSKEVNKATSLRNFIKMLLRAKGDLINDFSQPQIAKIDKSNYINSIEELRINFEKNGVLLLNMALIFTSKDNSTKHIKEFKPFMITLLKELQDRDIKLILLGNWAKNLTKIKEVNKFDLIKLPHPYNTSFITDENVYQLFKDMDLLISHIFPIH